MIGFRTAIKKFKFQYWQSKKIAKRYYFSTSNPNSFSSFLADKYLALLTKKLNKPSEIIDIGAGTGILTKRLLDYGFNVTAVDISKEMLDELKKGCQSDRLTCSNTNVFDLKTTFSAKKFDAAVSRWVIPHFPNWFCIIENVSGILKEGGYFLFDICCQQNYELANGNNYFDKKIFGYDNNNKNPAKNFYASSSIETLQTLANAYNFKVVSFNNLSFFSQNPIIASATPGYGFEEYRKQFDMYYSDNEIKKFIEWFELFVTPGLPHQLVNTIAVLLQKKTIL